MYLGGVFEEILLIFFIKYVFIKVIYYVLEIIVL